MPMMLSSKCRKIPKIGSCRPERMTRSVSRRSSRSIPRTSEAAARLDLFDRRVCAVTRARRWSSATSCTCIHLFPNIVYALDLDHDGSILWKYEPKQDPNVIPVMCCDTVNRGVAYGDGKIFLHQADTTLVALDAKTGAPVWSVKNGDPSKGATGTSAPLVVKDKVLVGISGGEFGVRGYLTAYDIKDGKQAWRAIPRVRTRKSGRS